MSASLPDHPEIKITGTVPVLARCENKSATDTRHAVALLTVQDDKKTKLLGGWVRFYLRNPQGVPIATFVETLSVTEWDKTNTGVGAWRTVTIPVPPLHSAEFQAARGDVKLVKFHLIP